ncbi:MAG: sulfatase-like hydrolase/transferase [Pseudomonadales bacterium]|nr:sulfatase-like hydrolase/transferase [Pseudomonadales bacterium]
MNWKHLFWALAFSASMLSARIIVGGTAMLPTDGMIAFVLSTAVGCGLSLVLSYLPKLVAGVLVIVVSTIYIGAFRYEGIFGVLPGPEVFFYASELPQLLPSIVGEFNATVVLTLSALGLGLTLAGLSSWNSLPGKSIWATALALLSLMVFTGHSFFTAPSSQSSEPVAWLMSQLIVANRVPESSEQLTASDFSDFLRFHGQRPSTSPRRDFPLCRANDDTPAPTGQSVIVLILENVGNDEMRYLPNLTRFADQHVWFQDFMSVGTKSVQALPAYLGGLPPNPHENYLWYRPQPNMPSLASALSPEGYTTGYFHGGDLSFEQQRHYLTQAEFEHIFEFGDYDYPIYGWGYSDESMFTELQHWTEQQEEPFLAVLATISSHHPYILPNDFSPASTEADIQGQYSLEQIQAYEYLDMILDDFFTWFESQDALLFIVGDHAPDRGDQKHKFHVPLIVAGLDSAQKENAKDLSGKQSIGYDLPNTILDSLGLPALGCSPGKPLLSPETSELKRYRYTVAGNNLEAVYFHDLEQPVAFEKRSLAFKETNLDGGFGATIPTEQVPELTIDLFQSIMRVHYDLLQTNTYAPLNPESKKGSPETTFNNTIFVSHRGNTNGEDRQSENRREAIEAAISSGMQWVEIDIQADKLGEPFLFHDPAVSIDGEMIELGNLTLQAIRSLPGLDTVVSLEEVLNDYSDDINFAIELKPLKHVSMLIRLTQRVRSLINSRTSDNEIIVDSFDLTLVRSIQRNCDCEVGFDHPYRQPVSQEDLDHYAMLGLDWIYLEHTTLSDALIIQAHQAGIKVMGYTVNASEPIPAAVRQQLDGVITDRASLKEEWTQ